MCPVACFASIHPASFFHLILQTFASTRTSPRRQRLQKAHTMLPFLISICLFAVVPVLATDTASVNVESSKAAGAVYGSDSLSISATPTVPPGVTGASDVSSTPATATALGDPVDPKVYPECGVSPTNPIPNKIRVHFITFSSANMRQHNHSYQSSSWGRLRRPRSLLWYRIP